MRIGRRCRGGDIDIVRIPVCVCVCVTASVTVPDGECGILLIHFQRLVFEWVALDEGQALLFSAVETVEILEVVGEIDAFAWIEGDFDLGGSD